MMPFVSVGAAVRIICVFDPALPGLLPVTPASGAPSVPEPTVKFTVPLVAGVPRLAMVRCVLPVPFTLVLIGFTVMMFAPMVGVSAPTVKVSLPCRELNTIVPPFSVAPPGMRFVMAWRPEFVCVSALKFTVTPLVPVSWPPSVRVRPAMSAVLPV